MSGEQAVRELLPNQGRDYNICSFANFKVQRLAFAWKKELGNAEECVTEEALSLPGEAIENRVRPGLSVALRIDGNLVRLLAVHLKSGCVSPLDENHGGDLSGSEQPCQLKQKQIVPLEKWIEKKSADASGLLVWGISTAISGMSRTGQVTSAPTIRVQQPICRTVLKLSTS